MSVQVRKRLLTVDEYEAMGRAGILGEDDRVELIEGEIIEMSPIKEPHASCVRRLNWLLPRAIRDRAIVDAQNPIVLSERSEPQPDLTLLLSREDFYRQRHPRPEDVFLLVEVADTSLAYDRMVKVPLYARARVPEVWIVDLVGQLVHVYREPSAGEYRDVRSVGPGEHVSPSAFPDVELEVSEWVG